MTLVFILIVVTVMLMMIQKLVARIQPGAEVSATPDIGGTLDPAKLRALMQLVITVVGLAGGGYVVLYGDYPTEVQYWASGLVGSVVGFWLK
jgi:hypothetical protein